MSWMSVIFGFSGPPAPPRAELTTAERAEILAELERHETENNERFTRIEERLEALIAEAGLEALREYTGHSHG